jgi:hypothetical protein
MSEESEYKTCRACKKIFIPDFFHDFYADEGGETGVCETCMMREAFAPRDPVHLEMPIVNDHCKPGKGAETCSYLVLSPGGKCMYACAKGSGLHESYNCC